MQTSILENQYLDFFLVTWVNNFSFLQVLIILAMKQMVSD